MSKIYLLFPFLVGLCTVVQGALNREISEKWGLSWALVWTSIVVLVLTLIMTVTPYFPGKITWSDYKWWYVIPGLCGFLIIVGIPFSIGKIGALNTFLVIIASQIIVSGAWDRIVEGMTLSWTRMLGAFVTMIGVWLASK